MRKCLMIDWVWLGQVSAIISSRYLTESSAGASVKEKLNMKKWSKRETNLKGYVTISENHYGYLHSQLHELKTPFTSLLKGDRE